LEGNFWFQSEIPFLLYKSKILNINFRNYKYKLPLVACIFVFTACLKDRVIPPAVVPPGLKTILKAGNIKINEIQPDFNADSGDLADWVEIYNTSDSTLVLQPGKFWITESKSNKLKFTPTAEFTIPSKGFLTIYFDGSKTAVDPNSIIYTEGNLSKSGEFVGLYYLAGPGDTVVLDTVSFGASPSQKESYGRVPNGGNSLKWLKDITRNGSNNVNIGGSGPFEPYEDMFIINEIAPNESPDWVEFYNPLPQNFTMKSGRWFFTDDLSLKTKDTLKVDFVLSPGKHYVVDCNDPTSPSDANQIRAKIKLSSTNGEAFGIYYKDDNGQFITIAEQTFPAGILAGKSYGRQPDKTGPFVLNINPSKGLPNP
jgi:hypothetical protein